MNISAIKFFEKKKGHEYILQELKEKQVENRGAHAPQTI